MTESKDEFCSRCESSEQELSALREVNQQLSEKVTQVIESTVPKEYHSAKLSEYEERVRSLEAELRNREERLKRLADGAGKEKEALVLKFATAEQRIIEAQRTARSCEANAREAQKERDTAVSRHKLLASEKERLQAQLEQRGSHLAAVEKELHHVKELLNSAEVKAKWAQNKLRDEQEAHRDAAKRLDEQQRQDSQEQRLAKELDSAKRQAADSLAELRQMREKLRLVEAERICQEEAANRSKESLAKVTDECCKLRQRIRHLAEADDQLSSARREGQQLAEALTEAQALAKEAQTELEQLRSKESELLEFSQKMSDKSAALQAEKLSLLNQQSESAAQVESLQQQLQSVQESRDNLQQQLQSLSGSQAEHLQSLVASLEQRSKTVEDLTVQLEDERNEIKTLKRKQAAMVKDLMRQLAAAKRKLDCQQQQQQQQQQQVNVTATSAAGSTGSGGGSGGGDLSRSHHSAQLQPLAATSAAAAAAADAHSLCSRTSSCSSLEAPSSSAAAAAAAAAASPAPLNGDTAAAAAAAAPAAQISCNRIAQQHQHQEEEDFAIKVVEPDRQALIEKIVRLQRDRSRRAEKIDFLNEHVRQLTEEMQRKSRLLQHYVLREDSGSIAPEAFDIHKASLSRKGGIMASLHTTQIADKNLTLEFSLEINRKMQSVLEDALLKNITLKDNISTLGDEIARLSRDNHRLRTQMGDQCDS